MKITDLHLWVTRPDPQARSFVFSQLEFDHAALHFHNSLVTPGLGIKDGALCVSDRPGLGVELYRD